MLKNMKRNKLVVLISILRNIQEFVRDMYFVNFEFEDKCLGIKVI